MKQGCKVEDSDKSAQKKRNASDGTVRRDVAPGYSWFRSHLASTDVGSLSASAGGAMRPSPFVQGG